MGCVRVGLVLSCLFISACLALSGTTTDEEEEKTDTVAWGRDQETEGRRVNTGNICQDSSLVPNP